MRQRSRRFRAANDAREAREKEEALRTQCNENKSTIAEREATIETLRAELEAAIADGSLWDEYDFDTTPSRVSLYSSDNPYFDQSVTHCSDVYAAQCMGAPCW